MRDLVNYCTIRLEPAVVALRPANQHAAHRETTNQHNAWRTKANQDAARGRRPIGAFHGAKTTNQRPVRDWCALLLPSLSCVDCGSPETHRAPRESADRIPGLSRRNPQSPDFPGTAAGRPLSRQCGGASKGFSVDYLAGVAPPAAKRSPNVLGVSRNVSMTLRTFLGRREEAIVQRFRALTKYPAWVGTFPQEAA